MGIYSFGRIACDFFSKSFENTIHRDVDKLWDTYIMKDEKSKKKDGNWLIPSLCNSLTILQDDHSSLHECNVTQKNVDNLSVSLGNFVKRIYSQWWLFCPPECYIHASKARNVPAYAQVILSHLHPFSRAHITTRKNASNENRMKKHKSTKEWAYTTIWWLSRKHACVYVYYPLTTTIHKH